MRNVVDYAIDCMDKLDRIGIPYGNIVEVTVTHVQQGGSVSADGFHPVILRSTFLTFCWMKETATRS